MSHWPQWFIGSADKCQLKIQLKAQRQSSSLSFKCGLVNFPHWSLGNPAVAFNYIKAHKCRSKFQIRQFPPIRIWQSACGHARSWQIPDWDRCSEGDCRGFKNIWMSFEKIVQLQTQRSMSKHRWQMRVLRNWNLVPRKYSHDCVVINQNVTTMSRARNGLRRKEKKAEHQPENNPNPHSDPTPSETLVCTCPIPSSMILVVR